VHLNRKTTILSPKGNIVYSEVSPHFIPDISQGVKISAIFHSVKKNQKQFGCLSNGIIFGLSKALEEQLNYCPLALSENKINIGTLFPEINF
jgi:hypothetical protein